MLQFDEGWKDILLTTTNSSAILGRLSLSVWHRSWQLNVLRLGDVLEEYAMTNSPASLSGVSPMAWLSTHERQ